MLIARGICPGGVPAVEPVGNETFVYFSTGTKEQYVARFATDTPPEVGKQFEMLFDTSKIHFFDKDTELALFSFLSTLK